jgi:hypothetical protein
VTDPALLRMFLGPCSGCGAMVRADLALLDGIARCSFCGAKLDAPAKPPSPIIGRKVFRSASLRDPARACPLLESAEKSTV